MNEGIGRWFYGDGESGGIDDGGSQIIKRETDNDFVDAGTRI